MADTPLWMPLYVDDYMGATQRLTCEQHGAYLLLIMDYWRNGPPPDDDEVLMQIVKLDRAKWRKHRSALAKLFQVEGGEWRHRRIEAVADDKAEMKHRIMLARQCGFLSDGETTAMIRDNGLEAA